mgnify:FL=1
MEKENKGYTYILTCIYIFSRWADAKPLKTKTASEVLEAFKEIILDRGEMPKKLWVDQGSEFLNKEMERFCKKNDIEIYHTFGEGKSVVVERFNRTLKTIMWKELTARNSHEWVAIVPELLHAYNNRKHSTLKMTPNEATKHPKETQEVWDRVLDKQPIVTGQTKFNVGDWVRISRIKGKFEKGYDQNWSQEIFKVIGVTRKYPPSYKLADYNGEKIKGSFYDQELQKTVLPSTFLVETIIKKKTVKGKKMELVKWLGYPEKFNSWIEVPKMSKR